MSPQNITVAITVYDRRQFIRQAIASALDQTVPVHVIVVEDCGPDPTLEGWVKEQFGSRIEYVRNPRRRGLFGNWNACLELCRTEWLSILHDDDFLAPVFVAEMLKLAGVAKGVDLYLGQTVIVNEDGAPLPGRKLRSVTGPWMRLGLTDVIYGSPLPFPGQLFAVAPAKSLGGFRVSSCYCAEWEMWAKLIARSGAAQTAEVVAFFRDHAGWNRETNRVMRSGKATPALVVQHKRVLALLPPSTPLKFDRAKFQAVYPMPVRFLLRYGASLSPRLLRYHVRLLLLSPAPHWRYGLFQGAARIFGPGFVRAAAKLWILLERGASHVSGAGNSAARLEPRPTPPLGRARLQPSRESSNTGMGAFERSKPKNQDDIPSADLAAGGNPSQTIGRVMRIAILVPDDRDEFRRYVDPEPYVGPAPSALLEGFAKMPACEVHVVCCIQKPLRSPPKLADNIYYHSVIVPKWGWMRGAYLGCVLALRKKLREIKPDLVHGQGTERYCALAAVFSGFPNVLTIHGNIRRLAKISRARPFSFWWLAARLERLALPRAGGVICLSRHTQRQVAALAARTWIVPNAVDGCFFEADSKPRPKPPGPRQILCVADILPLKNQVELILALDPLAQEQAFELIFFGRAVRGNPYVEEFLRLLEGRPWCRFAGFADRSGIRSALARAALLVLPTLEDNCPMVVLEAMAAGVPVAASQVGGIPDLISDGADGLLFDPGQRAGIGSAVARILASDEDAGRLARAGREKALHCFHPQAIARRHLEIYREVLHWTAPDF